jgi:hypothetical protein
MFTLLAADGVIIPSNTSNEAFAYHQMAIIRFFDNTEQLILLVKSESNYGNDFIWIIPTPSAPQCSTATLGLFKDLAEISKPLYQKQSYSTFGCGNKPSPGVSRDYYEIIQYANIHNFASTFVINTNNVDTLQHWLINNGYAVTSEHLTIFQQYINKNWTYFFCARILPSTSYYTNSFAVNLIFNTSEPVFPMKISKLNYHTYGTYNPQYDLFLYVIALHKMTFLKSNLLYANKLTGNEIQKIQTDFPELTKYLNENDFLTKLLKEHSSKDDFNDITLTQAKDDKEFRELYGSYYYYYSVALPFLPVSILFFLLLKIYYYIKKRRTQL